MLLLQILEKVSPSLVARMAFRAFTHPQVRKLREFEKTISQEAEAGFFPDFPGKIRTYKWGQGSRKALVLHGWEGRTSNFGKIIPSLLQNDFSVFGFDAPGHGLSESSNNPFLDYIHLIIKELKREDYDLIITHSTGSILCLWAMYSEKIPAKQLIVCTTPNRFEDRFDLTIKQLGLSNKTKITLMNLVQEQIGIDPRAVNASEFATSIQVQKAIFIQDKMDKVVPLKWTQAVQEALPNSELILLEGTGHFRMLWSEEFDRLIASITKENTI